MDRIEKLRALDKKIKQSGKSSLAAGIVTARHLSQLQERKKSRFEAYLPGTVTENEFGKFLLITETCSLEHRQGMQPLAENPPPALLKQIATGEPELSADVPRLAYLDTETTGLAGGAGTFAFLIGIGFWKNNSAGENEFIVEQYFMRDYDEEPAMLAALKDRFEREKFDAVVTYNGRCFDVPLLAARSIQNRQKDCISRLPQIDLLHPVRQLWKLKFGDCSLANIERELLGVRRSGDIPGEDIPRTYFQFVRGGDPRKMLPILRHNLMDVLSMVALIGRITDQLGKTTVDLLDPIELYCLGRIHLKKGAVEEADLFLRNPDPDCLPARVYLRSQKELSLAYKRKGNWEKAVHLWLETVESIEIGLLDDDSEGFDLFAYEELAKFFEHRKKDCMQAILFVNKALESVERLQQPGREPALKHRLERLQRKLEKEKSPECPNPKTSLGEMEKT